MVDPASLTIAVASLVTAVTGLITATRKPGEGRTKDIAQKVVEEAANGSSPAGGTGAATDQAPGPGATAASPPPGAAAGPGREAARPGPG